MKEEQSTAPIYHTVIIGAGASGLFCAGSFKAPKLVLEAKSAPALKVSFSGGKKCNFSNLTVSAADYESAQKHFCKSALAAFKPTDFTALLDEQKIPYEQREEGKLFGKNAQHIVDFLVKRAQDNHTTIKLNTRVQRVEKGPAGFVVYTDGGKFLAQNVVLACGGNSFPLLGGNSFGPKFAREIGIPLIEQRPALCGLETPKNWRETFKNLVGNSLPAAVSVGKKTFQNALLFTHRGISGPAVLSASLYWHEGEAVRVNFLPQEDVTKILKSHKNSTLTVSGALKEKISPKIAKTILQELDQPLANATKETLRQAALRLQEFTFVPTGTNGYQTAEVTAGGIDTRQINPSTFEVRSQKGLYIIGEILDVTGRLGGFNLHWAWCSGFCAAKALEKIY